MSLTPIIVLCCVTFFLFAGVAVASQFGKNSPFTALMLASIVIGLSMAATLWSLVTLYKGLMP